MSGGVVRCQVRSCVYREANKRLSEACRSRDNGFRPMPTTPNADLSRITVVPGQRSGQPCIRGLRVTVWDVLDMLAAGMAEDEILDDYPYLEKADFAAVYAHAAHVGREHASR